MLFLKYLPQFVRQTPTKVKKQSFVDNFLYNRQHLKRLQSPYKDDLSPL
jgi:hypothetical protein